MFGRPHGEQDQGRSLAKAILLFVWEGTIQTRDEGGKEKYKLHQG